MLIIFVCPNQFYQDTLETDGGTKEEEKTDTVVASTDTKEPKEECPESPSAEKEVRVKTEVDGEENEEASSRDSSKTDMAGEESPPSQSDSGKPKGVLVLHAHQKRRPKKVLQWRPEEELEMHHYFELDETERGMPPPPLGFIICLYIFLIIYLNCSQREQIAFRWDETSRERTGETIDSYVQDYG